MLQLLTDEGHRQTVHPNTVLTIKYRCTTPGPDVEQGVFECFWTGEIDTWGKLTFRDVNGGPTLYLFAREITVL